MAQNVNGNGSLSYLGKHERGVDPSSRIVLPFDWRPKGAPTRFTILTWPLVAPEHLLVLPPERWERFMANLELLEMGGNDSANLERLVSASATFCALDRFGRLPLSEQTLSTVGITDKAQLLGRLTKFEIWNPAKLSAQLNNPALKELAENLNKFKI